MLSPHNLQRMLIELIFVLLGALIVWLGISGRIFFDRRTATWLILSVALIVWGLWGLYRRGKWWARWEIWTRGLSLTLLGVVMLAIARAPFPYVGSLLAVAGLLLVARGVIGSIMVLRPR
jgi:hypothetical protein